MDNERQTLVEHLTDLRRTLVISLSSLAVTSVIGFYLAPSVMSVIRSLLPIDNLVFFGPMDAFYIQIRLAVIMGLILAFPVIASSFAWFLMPGMTAKEKNIAACGGLAFLIFFLIGAAYALAVVLPLVLVFLMSFSTPEMMPVVSGEEYLTFVLSFMVYSGLAFNLPLLVFLLTFLNIVSPRLIGRYRKYCFAVLIGIALFFSPGGDLITQILMALPLYLLFEAAVFTAKYVQKFRINIRGDSNV